MGTTSTEAGRAKLLHPDLGHDGGAGLWNKVNTMFDKIGDSLSIQYFGEYTVADLGTQDLIHNFDMNLVNLDVRIIESDVVLSQESQAVYGIAEKTGNEKNALTITNNSGGSKTFAVYVMGFSLDKLLGREKARVVTSDDTQTTLLSFAVPTDETMAFNVIVSAKAGTDGNYYELKGIAENASGTTTVRIVEETISEDDTAFACTLDASGADVRVRVTGKAATSVEWYCVAQKTYF